MPELRHDPITGATVVVAPERAARPITFRTPAPDLPARVDDCPFCPGNETMTPPEVWRRGEGKPDTPGWTIRVVPNLYPLVGEPGDSDGAETPATGAHEVVVLSPAHDVSLAELPADMLVEHLGVWRDRVGHHLGAGRAHAAPFVNHREAAGASIEHPHAQLVAVDFEPPALQAMVAASRVAGRDLLAEQLSGALDLTVVSGPAPAFCPRGSANPYELVVAHRSTRARFDEATDAEIDVVARSTHDALLCLRAALGDVAYNLVVHTAGRGPAPDLHWHVRVTPRVSTRAGFEMGTGVFVNVVSPEAAAETLREAQS